MLKALWAAVGAAMVLSLAAPHASAVDVAVDGSQKHQTIQGFGTCLVSWVPRMAEYYKTPEASKTYAETLRLDILRCNLWGAGTIGEMPVDQISYKDPNFAAKDPRTPVFIQFANAIEKINPNVKIIGTVWSPPAWMKVNKSITDKRSGAIDPSGYTRGNRTYDNRVDPKYYPHFVKWMVEMAKYYKAHGAPLYAISPANEPQFTQSFESCMWDAKDLATVIGMLGEELDKEGMGDVKIFAPETMTGRIGPNKEYLAAIEADPLAKKHFDIFASHGYTNGVTQDISRNSAAQLWDAIKSSGLPLWITEGGTGGHEWPAPIKNGSGLAIHNAFVGGNASAFVPWQFAGSGKPSEHELMPTSGMDKKTWAVWHFSHFIPAGSVRVDATPEFGSLNTSAYVNGSDLTIVLINPTDSDEPISLSLSNVPSVSSLEQYATTQEESGKDVGAVTISDGKASFTMPASSIVTLSTLK